MSDSLNQKNFDKEVLKSKVPVLVDFWAEWCGPCKMMAPVIDELSKKVKGAKVVKVNIEEEEGLASKYNVMSIPTFLFFKNGKIVDQMVGVVDKEKLSKSLEKLIN